MLDKIGANDIIQNVTLMGGAAHFKPAKEEQWVRIFSTVVNGSVKNLHTKKDLILLLYMISQKRQSALGRGAAFSKNKSNVEGWKNRDTGEVSE